MSVAMKCFERLVMTHINIILPETLDPLQFAYRRNRSTDDAISIALHTALSHLDKRNMYVRMFSLLPHGEWYRSAKYRSKRLLNSFYPQAVRLLSS